MPSAQGELFDLDELEPPQERFPAAFLKRPDKTPVLCQVHIEALKGIEDVTIDLSPPLTILTGPNNSGKSTVLQSILLGFDVLRRCVDTESWQILKTGRALTELEYLRANHPKDLWFRQAWREGKAKEKYIRVALIFDNGFRFVARVRFMYGALNIGIESYEPHPDADLLKSLLSAAPIFLPPSGGPTAHEPVASLAQLHYTVTTGDPARVLRSILWQIQHSADNDAWKFVNEVAEHYFGVTLRKIEFDEKFDLEIRADYQETDYALDIVSGGSGLNQILQLAAIIAWRKPGIVLLDEPDAHLHSTLQTRLLDFLYALSEHYSIQIIVSTHSRDLISQAPLQSILPIDLTRKELKPIKSLEHLLLEYHRQGVVSNVDLALLYQTKKCLFVEGSNDTKLLPKIADRLSTSVFKGRDQIVTFEFEGVENIKLIPKLVQLFERMIGASLSWAVVRDRDANIPEVINAYKTQAEQSGIRELFVWDSYCLENVLLTPELIHRGLVRLKNDDAPTLEIICSHLNEALDIVKPDVGGVYVTKTQAAYRALGKENPFNDGARDAFNFVSSLQTLEERLQYYPGKKVFGQFVQLLQDRHGINLRLDDIIAVLSKGNAPEELKRLFSALEEL
jgi:predicted ATPase